MKRKWHIIFLFLGLSTIAGKACYAIDETSIKEYQLKAAFLYNFIKFVDWPGNLTDTNEITIGIISKESFENLFEPLKDKKVKNKTVLVKQYPAYEELAKLGKQNKKAMDEQIESIQKCHLLFISDSEAKDIKEVLALVKDKNILTVGESDNFLAAGGIINFVVEEKKVRFEINLEASDKAKLKISSQVLQLAKKVIKTKEQS